MRIEFDPAKRAVTLKERGLDFEDATKVFAGVHFEIEDDRQNYGETRWITVGRLGRAMVAIVWTPRGEARRIISMRKCNAKERKRFKVRLGGP
ncbi:BrnT family toxin [Phenylobacterium montanum]|uniref:BrnT family toxin n=1 Tax=Phenylobacterium montanum TaxID=2823693 RepID=A0A975G1T3_9CAUL|nr:BrnT family toxin [Caulobacter sp. S6]QUD89209.1 BrnT family toxin [Caulobacter sp. S6]